MRENPVKVKINAGGVSIGTMSQEFITSGLPRLSAAAGAEFNIYDMEHTSWSIETMRSVLAANAGIDIVPIVRVPATEYHFMARMMDAGAMGIKVPMVHNAAQARRIVDACKYPPIGKRGSGFSIAHDDYIPGDVVAKMPIANEHGLVIVQIESPEGVANAAEIAAVEGVDVLWIGHFDLSNFMGIPAQFDHPDFEKAVDTVIDACEKEGKTVGRVGGLPEECAALIDRGVRIISYGVDLDLYRNALTQGIGQIRKHPKVK
ncbi:MAG: aldolase/citrate lyase family protein [Candidatus Latescibacterota bacterium]|nr:aldolase/citrate lyase family protein [Candidatus Latescibacterota bacterium]